MFQKRADLVLPKPAGRAGGDFRGSAINDTLLVYSMSERFYFDGKSVAIPRGAGAMKRARCPTGARIKASDTHKNPDDVLVIPVAQSDGQRAVTATRPPCRRRRWNS